MEEPTLSALKNRLTVAHGGAIRELSQLNKSTREITGGEYYDAVTPVVEAAQALGYARGKRGFEHRVMELEAQLRAKQAKRAPKSAVVLEFLESHPVWAASIGGVEEGLGMSYDAARMALNRLLERQLVRREKIGGIYFYIPNHPKGTL